MQSGTVGIIQPVAGIERKEFDFSTIRQIRGFVNDESARFDGGLDGHGESVLSERQSQQRLRVDKPFTPSIGTEAGFCTVSKMMQ